MAKRDESFWNIFNAVIRLEVQRGHLKWTMAELSRASGVGRSSIYHYFGSKKEDILGKAVVVIGEEFYGLSEGRMQLWNEGRIADSVMRSREMTIENPYLILFFLTWRKNKHTPLYEELIQLEKRYIKKLQTAFPGVPKQSTTGLYAFFFGLVSVPHLDPNDIPAAVNTAVHMMNGGKHALPGSNKLS